MNPLVSVVVTTYNQAPYIEQALKSVLVQTYKPYEVIVVDDGSTDETPTRLASYGNQIVYVHQRNQGVAGSRNTGIRRAKGEFIAFLDGDDLWDPGKLFAQVEVASRHPNSGLIVVDGVEFNNTGIISTSLLSGPYGKNLPEDQVSNGCYYHQFLKYNFICTTSQVMVPAKVFQTVGLSNKRFKRANDYDLYIRIAAKFDVAILKKRFVWWRYLQTSASGPKNNRDFGYLPEMIAILRDHMRESHGDDGALIRRIIEAKVAEGAEKLYYYGLKTDRVFATRVLLKLLAGNLASPLVAVFLAGLWCPRAVTSKLGRPLRRMLFRNNNE